MKYMRTLANAEALDISRRRRALDHFGLPSILGSMTSLLGDVGTLASEEEMSGKSGVNDGKTLKQKLEAANGGEAPRRAAPSRGRPALTLPMIVLLLVLAGAAIATAAAFPWLLQQPREMFAPFIAGVAILIVGLSIAFSVLADRRTDEWHRSATRFASQWGYQAGLLLALPLIIWLNTWIGSLPPDRYPALVKIGVGIGFLAVIISQVVCVALLHLGWMLWMSRSHRGSHEEQD
jgi:hypothetical protein